VRSDDCQAGIVSVTIRQLPRSRTTVSRLAGRLSQQQQPIAARRSARSRYTPRCFKDQVHQTKFVAGDCKQRANCIRIVERVTGAVADRVAYMAEADRPRFKCPVCETVSMHVRLSVR